MSETSHVETRLRNALHETAATVEPSDDAWARVVERIPTRRARRPVLWLATAVAAVLVAIVAAVALLTRSGTGEPVHVTGTAHDAVVLVPGSVPSGMVAFPDAAATNAIGLTCTEGRYVGGRLDCATVAGYGIAGLVDRSSRRPSVQIATFVNNTRMFDRMLQGVTQSGDVVVRGRRAEVWRGRFAGGEGPQLELLALRWTERPGVDVVVESQGADSLLPFLVDVANHLTARPVESGALPLAVATISPETSVAAGRSVDGFPCLTITGAPCGYAPTAPNGMVALVAKIAPQNGLGLYGAVPTGTARVRVDLGGRTLLVDAHDGPPGNRYFGALVSEGQVRSVDALDSGGRVLATVTPLDTTDGSESPGSGTGEVVRVITAPNGTRWTVRAQWQRNELCVSAESGDGDSSTCGVPTAVPLGGPAADDRIVYGWTSLDVASVRVTVDGRTVEVTPVRRSGFPVAFFATPRSTGGPVAIEARDARGRVLESLPDISDAAFGTSSSGSSSSSSKSATTIPVP